MSRSRHDGRPSPAALRRELRKLARDFADDVVALLEEQGMWDEPAPESDALGARRMRRSPDDLLQVMDAILDNLSSRTAPVSIGEVAEALQTTSRRITHPMSLLVEDGKVVRTGERRGARYEVKRRRASKKASKAKSTRTAKAKAKAKAKRGRKRAPEEG